MEQMMQQDILQSARYPEIVFESTGAAVTSLSEARWQVNAAGNVTLRGVTREQNITITVTRTGDMLRANGEFTLLQSTYGIKPVSVAGGTLKLKDELKFLFDVVARKHHQN
jgi:polyisoprenoid-binding protein YceI